MPWFRIIAGKSNCTALAGAACLDDDAAAWRFIALPNSAAFDMMTPPLHAMMIIAMTITVAVTFMNGNTSLTGTNDDFSGSRKGSQHVRGNYSAQNKQMYF